MSHLAETTDSVLEGFELSPQQARLWPWQQRLAPAAGTAELRLRLPADVDQVRLRQSLDLLVQRHEILRTRYRQLPGMAHPVQVIRPTPVVWNTATAADQPTVTLAPAPPGMSLTLRLPGGLLDTASLYRLSVEWARLYRGESLGEGPLQYADYAAWRNELLDGDVEAQHFWRQQAAMQASAVGLPLRRTLPAPSATLEPARLACLLPPELAEACAEQAAILGCQPARLLLAAWLALWHQHSDADRLTLGLDWQSRDDHLQDALGLFSEPLPLTVDSLAERSFAELARALVHRGDALLGWRDYFPSQAWPERPLLGFRYVEIGPHPVLTALGWQLEQLHSPTAPGPLLLEVQARTTGLALDLHYDQTLYAAEDAALLAEQLTSLLADACRRPAGRLTELSACSDQEQIRWHEQFSRSAALTAAQTDAYAEIANRPSLAACFERQARLHGRQPAVQGPSGVLSYDELDTQAQRLGQCLLARGMAAGSRIVHFLPRDTEAIVALLAIIKAGGCYLPVDPDYPAERIAHILADADPHCVITRQALVSRLPADWQRPERLLLVDAPAPAPDSERPWPASDRSQWAYLIYTSGSTGTPKGVPITQAGALHSLAARVAYYPEPVRRFLLLSSFAFDSAIAGLFWSLAQGGCLHLCSEIEQKDPTKLARLIREHGVSHLLALPSLHQLLLRQIGSCPTLRTVIVAGEACPPTLVAAHQRQLPDCRLYNEYGPTEAAVWSTIAECRPTKDSQEPVPIGRPAPHSRIYLLDDQGRLVARGLKGEIHIAGPGLSPGYLHGSELTAAKFVSAPPSLPPGERLYRSGDLAYLNAQGELIFLGRTDDQIKIRGYRVELGEIEAQLRREADVAEAVVLADQTAAGTVLRAFVESGRNVDGAALLQRLRQRLPAYMVPAEIQVLDQLPRTANGKFDKQALQALRQLRAVYSPPRRHTEQVLASLWQSLLGVDHIGVDDDFFALGGHSLLVVQLLHQIKTVLHRDLAVSAVFRHSTLGALARHLDADPSSSEPVLLRPGKATRAPLFCLHDPAGAVQHYLPLAAAVPEQQRVYGLTLSGAAMELSHLTALADHHLATLRAAQAHGPYYLCGWSLGGILALELAQRLAQAGERIAFLGIIDSTFDADDDSLPLERLLALYAKELAPASRERLAALPDPERARLQAELAGQPKLAQLRHLLLEYGDRQGFTTRAPRALIEYELAAMANARRWLSDYRAPRVSVDLHLWWADETLRHAPQLPARWQRCTAGKAHNQIIGTDHDSILTQADFLAQFQAALDQSISWH